MCRSKEKIKCGSEYDEAAYQVFDGADVRVLDRITVELFRCDVAALTLPSVTAERAIEGCLSFEPAIVITGAA